MYAAKRIFMKEAIIAPATPAHTKGKFVDTAYAVEEPTLEEAIVTYNRACARMLNPPVWEQLTGGKNVSFKLATENEDEVQRLAKEGDYFKIDLPGPGSASGQGYDWVKVETIEENTAPDADDSLAMRLRACSNPHTEEESVAHFFQEDATSTFIVRRKDKKVSFSYHGRNEVSNTTEVPVLDKMRNAVVALGAEAGLSDVFWSALVKAMLQKEIGG